MKTIIILFAMVLGLLGAGCSNEQNATNVIDEEQLRSLVSAKILTYGIPGIQVCIKDQATGKTIKLSMGYSDLETRVPLRDTTQIKIGSITKSFTALGILKLAQDGLLNLDDEVGTYQSIENDTYRNITLRQLMNMDSGLRGYLNDDPTSYVVDSAIADPARQFTPGELVEYGFKLTDEQGMTGEGVFHYNNTNYILLGMVIEKVSRTGYAECIRRELVEPLGLPATYVPTGNAYGGNVSSGYHIDKEDKTTENLSAIDLSYVWSAGAIISTATDLCDWIISVATGKIVAGDMVNLIYSGVPAGDTSHYTAGLINQPDKLWHNGTVLGYHGEVCYLKNSRVAVAVLSNCTFAGIDGDPVKEIMNGIIAMITAKAQ
mgnify:CR=1 FL=1